MSKFRGNTLKSLTSHESCRTLLKILILRFSSIGDIVLTTPVIRCLKQQLPGVEIHYFTKPAFASVLKNNPYIDRLHLLDAPLLTKCRELKSLGFDYIIDLHHNMRTMVIKSVMDVPSYAFDKINFEKWMLVNLKVNISDTRHVVDRYMETVKPLGVVNDGKGLEYFIPEGTEIDAPLPATYIAIAIGAQHATKRLPEDKLIALCNQLHLPVVLLGGAGDAEIANRIAHASTNEVISLCGVLSLDQSALVIKKAYKVITHDTGLMHIAAALKKEILSIWGNTVPAFGMTPYMGQAGNKQFEVEGLSCRPCSKIGHDACPKQHFNCMNLQSLESIAEAAKAWVY